MLRVAIVEDEAPVRETLTGYINRFSQESGQHITVTEFQDGDEILDGYSADYDLILLDIQMKRIDGYATAQKIRALDEDVILVFVTNMADYAIKGYGVKAMDFILKPVEYVMLRQVLKEAQTLVSRKQAQYITVSTDKGMVRLKSSDIYYIESLNHIMMINTSKGKYTLRDTMKHMEELFSDYNFSRCNNSYLVNLEKIDRVDKKTVFIMGDELPISRPRYKEFMDELTAFLGRS